MSLKTHPFFFVSGKLADAKLSGREGKLLELEDSPTDLTKEHVFW